MKELLLLTEEAETTTYMFIYCGIVYPAMELKILYLNVTGAVVFFMRDTPVEKYLNMHAKVCII